MCSASAATAGVRRQNSVQSKRWFVSTLSHFSVLTAATVSWWPSQYKHNLTPMNCVESVFTSPQWMNWTNRIDIFKIQQQQACFPNRIQSTHVCVQMQWVKNKKLSEKDSIYRHQESLLKFSDKVIVLHYFSLSEKCEYTRRLDLTFSLHELK